MGLGLPGDATRWPINIFSARQKEQKHRCQFKIGLKYLSGVFAVGTNEATFLIPLTVKSKLRIKRVA